MVRVAPGKVRSLLAAAARGPALDAWAPPGWLLPHQTDAARRLAARLQIFGGAVLADAVGLGKTYVALAISTRYRQTVVVAPACLLEQWRRVSETLGVAVSVVSAEALSREARLPPCDLLIVDEAHRFRNPTRRRARLATELRRADALLLTATPVVNGEADLIRLLQLILPDTGLSVLGLSSLERSLTDAIGVMGVAARVIVARGVAVARDLESRIPTACDTPVVRLPAVAPPALRRMIAAVEELQFPTLGSTSPRELLRLHLWLRLGSSSDALRSTLRRHMAYLDRARGAAEHGKPLPRGLARRLFGPGDDLQLEMPLVSAADVSGSLAVDDIERERDRVLTLLTVLPPTLSPNPKAEHLMALLAARGRNKTIVFTSAPETALDLARRLSWRRTAVIAGGRARIATGPLSVEQALSLFAPIARSSQPPNATRALSVLLTTDMVSEGLDLQDADAIVHYDLPWTPVRLAQRLGRTARLGAAHDRVAVYWFALPAELEARARVAARLAAKAGVQLRAPMPLSSRVGRAAVANRHLAALTEITETGGGGVRAVPRTGRYAVVSAPLCAAAAVRWRCQRTWIPDLLVFDAHTGELREVAAIVRSVRALLDAAECNAPPSPVLTSRLARIVRARLRACQLRPPTPAGRRLRQAILSRARTLGRNRDVASLAVYDAILDRLAAGVRSGGEQRLAELLRDEAAPAVLQRWLKEWDARPAMADEVVVDGVLFGDGSLALQRTRRDPSSANPRERTHETPTTTG